MENKGHELSLTLKPLNGVIEGLDFDIFGTYSKNENEVIKITDDIDELTVGTYGFSADTSISIVAKKGYHLVLLKVMTMCIMIKDKLL